MEEKEYKTGEEQIAILKSRGLLINDEIRAKEILSRTNYYNLINGYKDPFLKETYKEGSTLEEIIALYKFDKAISRLFLSFILDIENTFKTVISNFFSSKYGHKNTDYLKPENFNIYKQKNKESVNKLIQTLNQYIFQDNEKKAYLLHYKYKHKYVPLWVLVNYMNLGEIIWFYSSMKSEDRSEIAKQLSISKEEAIIKSIDEKKIMAKELENMFKTIQNFRNISAHNERFYDYQYKNNNGIRYTVNFNKLYFKEEDIQPQYLQREKLNIQINPDNKTEYISIYSSIFAVVLIFKVILLNEEFEIFFNRFIEELEILKSSLKSIEIKDILSKMDFTNECVNLDNIEKIKKFFNRN